MIFKSMEGITVEKVLRRLIPIFKLYNYPKLIWCYEQYVKVRYKRVFNKEISFRNRTFQIGRDVTLFPSVYLGTYESKELDIMLSQSLEAANCIWDVGANVGLYTVLLGTQYQKCNVLAFEPNVKMHPKIVNNCALNNFENFTIISSALSNENGKSFITSKDSRAGAGRISGKVDTGNSRVEINTITGDDFLQSHPEFTPQLIKIDVEGHEPEVIEGMQELLTANKPVLMIEVFGNLWESKREIIWNEMIYSLFNLYGSAILVSDGQQKKVRNWDKQLISGGMQTLIFGTNS